MSEGTAKRGVGGATGVETSRVSGFAAVNGTRLFYELAGAGPPLVLIHGFTLDARMWDDQFEQFARNYRVMRYDLRGYGRSAVPSDEVYSHSDDLADLLIYLNLPPATFIGLSMGGEVAIDFALDYPDAVRALILADAALAGFPWSTDGTTAQMRSRSRTLGVQAARNAWISRLTNEYLTMGQPDIAARLGEILSGYSGWHWLYGDPRRQPDPPAAQQLHRICVRTLILVGDQDEQDFQEIAALLERQLPDARKLVLPGVRHLANMEQPERFAEIVLDFLGQEWRR